jgi:ABC-type Fe3+/spermidine/putrescine transport system ATPase subunit
LARKLALTVVYVSRDQGEGIRLSDKVVMMRDGRSDQLGPLAEHYARQATL